MNPLKEGLVELTIIKLASGGQGLARPGGEAVLVPGALPGETVLARLLPRSRGVRHAQIVEVTKPSPLRVQPDCPWAHQCGGCDFIHVRPEAALPLKARAALEDLAKAAGLEPRLVESPTRDRYRGRVTLHLGPGQGGQTAIGFYDRRRRIIEFEDCRLMDGRLLKLIHPLRQWAAALPPGEPEAEITLSVGLTGHQALAVAAPSPSGGAGRGPKILSPVVAEHFKRLPYYLAGTPVGLYFRPKLHSAPRPAAPGGPQRLTAARWPDLGDLTLTTGPGEFTQVNPAVNHLMVSRILKLAAPLAPGRALDLYSGHGNIALPLARSGFQVTLVEQSPASIRSARLNSRGLKTDIIEGPSEEAALKLAGQKYPLIILDPPRSGARLLAPALAALGAQMIIYVACRPIVLSRDLPTFSSLGYQPTSLTALDMFPRTSHLEAMLIFERA